MFSLLDTTTIVLFALRIVVFKDELNCLMLSMISSIVVSSLLKSAVFSSLRTSFYFSCFGQRVLLIKLIGIFNNLWTIVFFSGTILINEFFTTSSNCNPSKNVSMICDPLLSRRIVSHGAGSTLDSAILSRM